MKISGKLNLAKAFKVSRTTVENWCKDGCPSKFNGKEHEFTLSEVIAWHEKKFMQNGDTEGLTKARAVIAHFKGLITELEYREKSGELVPVEDVKRISFESGRMTRDSILNIPARVSAILAAEHDTKKVYELLTQELRQALENLANKFNSELLQKLLQEEAENDKNAN